MGDYQMKRPMIEYIIEALEPTFADFVTTETSLYWEEYESELTVIRAWSHVPGAILEDINSTLGKSLSSTGFYNAACDVASCLESLCPEEYAGRFMY